MFDEARRRGWGTSEENKIYLFIENQQADGSIKNASGTLRIDERPGLSALMELVYKDVVKAIFAYNESRLFRDEFNIQVDTFIKACYDHDVMVLTQTYQYDFRRHPYDADQFRMQNRISSGYITGHVKGVLHPMRKRKQMRGLAVAGGIPVGYVVDYNKDSPTYRKLIPYPSHAEVVCWLFRRYRELGGGLNALGRELSRMPVVFPDFDGIATPTRFKLKKVPGGYTLGRNGLVYLLTNVSYIGWWSVKGVVVSKNNHEPIVDEADFWYAFNRLSSFTPDGEEQVKIGTPPARYNKITTEPIEALLRDVITGEGEKSVYVAATSGTYRIYENINSFAHTQQSFPVSELDGIATEQFIKWSEIKLWRLQEPAQGATVGERLEGRLPVEGQEQGTSIPDQLARVNKRMTILRRNLDLDADQQTLEAWAKELKGLAPIKDALEKKIKETEEREAARAEYEEGLQEAGKKWSTWSFEKRKRMINLAIEKVVLSAATPHFFRLEIRWAEPFDMVEVGYIWDNGGTQEWWSLEEDEVLRELYAEADRAAVLERLPKRSWRGIVGRACALGVPRPKSSMNTSTMPVHLSFKDARLLKHLPTVSFIKGEVVKGEGVEFDPSWLKRKSHYILTELTPGRQWTTYVDGSDKSVGQSAPAG